MRKFDIKMKLGNLNLKKGIHKKGKSKKKLLIFGALAVILVIGGGVALKGKRGSKMTGANAKAQQTATVIKGTLSSSLSSSGTISPKDTYEITSLAKGEIIAANFEEGDTVEEGQVLYQIDVSSMESELNSATNSLKRAQTSYEQAIEDYDEAVADYSGNTYKATRTGYIKELFIEAGDKVSSNTELAKIYNDKIMKIKVPFLAGEAAQIGIGNGGTITLADTDEQLWGTVTAVSNMDEVLEGGRLVRYVTLQVENPGGLTTSHRATVQIGDFLCSAEGSFEPITDTSMRAEMSGNGGVEIEALLVHEGDYVTIGTPIFQIKASDVEEILNNYKDAMETAQEKVESAQSKLDSTQDSYDEYTITAPISGRVITKNAKVGDKISTGSGSASSTLAVIYDLSEVTFEMSVDELDVRDVKVGQKVTITADAIENTIFTGKVTNVSLQSSYSSGVTNYPVTITLDEVGELLPGMNVDGVIVLEEAQDTLMVPVGALMRGNRVYVKDDSVKEAQGNVPAGFRAVEVKTGLTNDEYVEILEGISEGDVVYVTESASSSSTMMFPGGGMQGGGGMPGGNGGGMPGGNGGGMQGGGGGRR